MTTLKLNKKSLPATDTTRAPIRRGKSGKRDRSVAPPPKPTFNNAIETESSDARQIIVEDKPVATNTPIKDKPISRSEYAVRDRTESTEKPTGNPALKNNTNTRKREDREGTYRNPPRRGGKAKDGFVASEFDKNRNNKQAESTQANLPRLSKRMAELGLCSRREADEWITNGWVKVDGVIIDTLGTRINPDAEIIISGYAKEYQAENVTILLHKPIGHVSGQAEDGYKPAIVLVHPDNEWLDDPDLNEQNEKEFQRGFLKGLAPAGRLDIDSTGLLILTQDGRIARHLIGQDSKCRKRILSAGGRRVER